MSPGHFIFPSMCCFLTTPCIGYLTLAGSWHILIRLVAKSCRLQKRQQVRATGPLSLFFDVVVCLSAG